MHRGPEAEAEMIRAKARWYRAGDRSMRLGPSKMFDYWFCSKCTEAFKRFVRERAVGLGGEGRCDE